MGRSFGFGGRGAAVAHKALKLAMFFVMTIDAEQFPVTAVIGVVVVIMIDMVHG